VAEELVDALQYKMIMALSAADLGSPMCEQAAAICAEIAEQHCAELHVTSTAHVFALDEVSMTEPSRMPSRR
jgi:hypothetical protein